jgi:exopolysaccharide biosynthesis protein
VNRCLRHRSASLLRLACLLIFLPLSAAATVSSLTVRSERDVSPGVRYVEYATNGKSPATVHVLIYDRTVAGSAIRVVKGRDLSNGRERLKEMSARYTSQTANTVLGIINANFWSAVRNTPIGPCVIDGEVVEMTPYKQWSSAFFDIDNRIVIDTFQLSGWVQVGGLRHSIGSTNRRIAEADVVLYNSFVGETVPYVTPEVIQKLFSESVNDEAYLRDDSTEIPLDTTLLKAEILRAQQEANSEHPMIKVRLRYLRQPSVNRETPCRVMGIDSGTVDMPLRGCLLSFPRGAFGGKLPAIGDTIVLNFSTNVHSSQRFMNAVCGTPRLVRDGKAHQEAQTEGSTGRRFIRNSLARTCIGTDRLGNKLFLVAVEPSNRAERQTGATLADVAQIMRLLGAYQAMNLDGGGSTGMVVQDKHVFFEGDEPPTRPVSVGLAIVRLSHVLRQVRE